MCGLVGMAGDINKKEKDAFKVLLVIDTLRGPHSTGVASINGAGDWSLSKKKGNAWDLFDSKEYGSTIAQASYCLIGHNRYATKGRINNINAHPFEFEDVVGAHNGTIRNQSLLPDHAQFEVDSENIIWAIQKEGLEETLSKLNGAYALTYWDKRSEELVLVRNNERDLFTCYSEDGKTLFWASESWMLYAALGRAGVKHSKPEMLPVCQIHRYKFDRTFTPKEKIRVNIRSYQEYVAPRPSPGYHSPFSSPYHGGSGSKKTTPLLGSSSEKSASQSSEGKTKPSDVINKRVDFTVDGTARNVYGQAYVSGSLSADPSLEVRIYAPEGGKLWGELMTAIDCTLNGLVKSYKSDSNSLYLTLGLDTIELVEDEEDDGDDAPFLGFRNRLLTAEEWGRKTDKGCAWCSGQVTEDYSHTLEWVDDDTFVCADCQSVDEVKEYLEMAG